MSSLGVASATSARARVAVLSREVIFAGAIVKERIPLDAQVGRYDHDGKDVPFLQFARAVPGGRVNLFVHTSATSLLGETICASATLWKKTLEDGRAFLYVDLIPVSDDQKVTHRLVVMNRADSGWGEDCLIFDTPAPLRGLVIFAPPEAKMPPRQNVVRLPQKQQVPVPAAPKDAQLERLLGAGWQIDSEDENKACLFRMKGQERRTMTHHKPKTKSRK